MAFESAHGYTLLGEEAVFGLVFAHLEHRRILKGNVCHNFKIRIDE
jgi:hypothetical protein